MCRMSESSGSVVDSWLCSLLRFLEIASCFRAELGRATADAIARAYLLALARAALPPPAAAAALLRALKIATRHAAVAAAAASTAPSTDASTAAQQPLQNGARELRMGLQLPPDLLETIVDHLSRIAAPTLSFAPVHQVLFLLFLSHYSYLILTCLCEYCLHSLMAGAIGNLNDE